MLIISNTVTNTLATITNGTNIYLQQQITTTHISNITETLTNTINNIPQLDKVLYQDPTLWGAVATVVSAIIMACTFLKIKQQEKDTQYREDKKELREYIEKHLIPDVEKQITKLESLDSEILEQDLETFNIYSHLSLVQLQTYSTGLFYEERLRRILNTIKICSHIIESPPKEYSYKVKRSLYILLHLITVTLYKALIDEKVFEGLMRSIDSNINRIEEKLTDEERQKIELHNS